MFEKATLVKFGQYEHICQLRDEGLLYMNNLTYFRKIEDEQRRDKYEGIDVIKRGNNVTIIPVKEPKRIMHGGKWEVGIDYSQPEKINIYCMCAARPKTENFPIDEKNFKFGDFALILTKPQNFFERISLHLNLQNIKGKTNLVEYVDNNYAGEMGAFRKRKEFEYQSEWRLACDNGNGKERRFIIGSIKDISVIEKKTEVNQRISEILNVTLP